MKKNKKLFLCLFCLSILFSLTGCEKEIEKIEKEEIKIPVCFLIDQESGKSDNQNLVDTFNKKYKGTYQLEVDWVTDSAEGFRDRIKILNGTDKLPVIITDVGFDADFYELLIANNRLMDLTPYLEKDEEWTNALDEKIIEHCKEKNGKTYLMPLGTDVHSYAGFYYNKELFHQAGIYTFPNTWQDFFQCLDILSKDNITPLALHGGSSYWTALLIGTNYMARNKEGMEFLNTQFPHSYKKKTMEEMLKMMKKMYEYTEEDGLEIEHGKSRERFIEGRNAILANGGWMLETLPEEVKRRTGFAPFPGNVMMEEPKMTAWAITNGYSEEVTKGAVEFLKYRTLLAKEDADVFLKKKNNTTLEKEYKRAIQRVERITPNYQLKWENEIQNKFFVSEFPNYVQGKISLKEFLNEMDKKVKEIEREK